MDRQSESQKLDKKGLTEAQAIAAYQKKNYPKPALTADIVVTGKKDKDTTVLLIRRGGHPYLGCWALPGGFANANECVEETAARELAEETGVSGLQMKPVGLFSRPGRDPRGWVVSQAYTAFVDPHLLKPVAGDDADQVAWFSICQTDDRLTLSHGGVRIEIGYQYRDGRLYTQALSEEKLAFDHGEILLRALAVSQ